MKSNVSSIHNCFGCGVCSAACSKKIISIGLNNNGFYEPRIIEPDKCTDCGICIDVCAFNNDEPALKDVKIKSWAAWSDNENIRRKCSSGGVGFEIGKQLIEHGYYAVGCRYDIKKQRAEHYIATTVDEFEQSIGSKYIQSYTEEAFKQINKNKKYLITGTPCQIDSFRRMIRKFHCEDNFILMDFFCHCVPSMWAWKAYLKMLEPKIGKITYASWRNKFISGVRLMDIDSEKRQVKKQSIDWHDSYYLLIKGEKNIIESRMSQGDLFYKLFLGEHCLGSQCEKNCKYKYDHTSADIRIGDLWGETYKYDTKGVSALITFTDKGRKVVESLREVTLVEHPFDVVAEGQMKMSAKASKQYNLVMWCLKKQINLSPCMWNAILWLAALPYRISGKIKKTLHNG